MTTTEIEMRNTGAQSTRSSACTTCCELSCNLQDSLHLEHFRCIPLNELQGEFVFLFILIISKSMQCKYKLGKLKMSYNLFAYKIESKQNNRLNKIEECKRIL